MIRFRFVEDEKRFLKLLSEVYRHCGQHLPPVAMTSVLRNFGKMQDMLLLEGVRQGVAVAELAGLVDQLGAGPAAAEGDPMLLRSLKAFQAYTFIYGSSDTPLRNVELELLKRLQLEPDTSAQAWLDNKPMRFAPETEQEALAERYIREDPERYKVERERAREAIQRAETGAPPEPYDLDEDKEEDDDFIKNLMKLDPATEAAVEEPATLDHIRDVIKAKLATGWQPRSWTALIMDLHLELQSDAGFLDLQMSTQMGLTVLAQCGIHLNPGTGIDMSTVVSKPEDTV